MSRVGACTTMACFVCGVISPQTRAGPAERTFCRPSFRLVAGATGGKARGDVPERCPPSAARSGQARARELLLQSGTTAVFETQLRAMNSSTSAARGLAAASTRIREVSDVHPPAGRRVFTAYGPGSVTRLTNSGYPVMAQERRHRLPHQDGVVDDQHIAHRTHLPCDGHDVPLGHGTRGLGKVGAGVSVARAGRWTGGRRWVSLARSGSRPLSW